MIPLDDTNPYFRGFVFRYQDNRVALKRKFISYIPTPNDKYYEASEGDTLWGISSKKYQSSVWWWLIYEVNRAKIKNPLFLESGILLLIPNLTQFRIQNP